MLRLFTPWDRIASTVSMLKRAAIKKIIGGLIL